MRIQLFHVIGIVWVSITREIEEQNFGVPYLQHEYWEQNGRVYTIHPNGGAYEYRKCTLVQPVFTLGSEI